MLLYIDERSGCDWPWALSLTGSKCLLPIMTQCPRSTEVVWRDRMTADEQNLIAILSEMVCGSCLIVLQVTDGSRSDLAYSSSRRTSCTGTAA